MRHVPALRLLGLTRVWILQFALCLFPVIAPAEDVHPVSFDMSECARLLDEHTQAPANKFDATKKTVVVVDGYSSGRLLAPALREEGFQVVHVHATGGLPEKFEHSFWPSTFERCYRFLGSLGPLLKILRRINVVAVIPGTDTGVLMADRISAQLHVTNQAIETNGREQARKNKFEMQERIKAAGLDSIRQILTDDVEEAIRWARKEGLMNESGFSLVIKPLSSAGGEGVTEPTTEAALRRQFKKLLQTQDALNNTNSKVLLQEKLVGVEYALNSTIWNGQVLYTDIWEYHKRRTASGKLIYDFDVLIPYEGKMQKRLRRYDREVLKALGITHGNSHSEIMFVEGRGPVLIEVNNRPMGATQPAFARIATGRSQIEATAMAIADRKGFKRLKPGYTMNKHAVVFSIANLYDRRMRVAHDAREKLRRLPGFFRDLMHVEPGDITSPAQDMFNSVGDVWLYHDSLEVLMQTVDELHAMERNGALFLRPDRS